jgi:predicted signal transduction protein with EAL and GGDEF domain
MGDARLTARLLQMTGLSYDQPTANIPQASGAAKAAYRFLDNEKIEWQAILAPHYAATAERVRETPLVCDRDPARRCGSPRVGRYTRAMMAERAPGGAGLHAETLLKHADTALYQAKERGRNHYQFFDRQAGFGARVEAILCETGVSATLLELETTESTLRADPEHVIRVLRELHGMGIQLTVDDFGTGYSSLSYLKRVPLDRIKIDRSFVRDIPGDPDDVAIAQAILAMAIRPRLDVVAEGVETAEQYRFLREHHCQAAQGYFFGKPLAAEACAELLTSASLVGGWVVPAGRRVRAEGRKGRR